MSQENVEIAERWVDAFNGRDVAAFAALVTPDFEWRTIAAGTIEGGSFRGRVGIEAYFEDQRSVWEKVSVISDEFRDLGDRVLVLGRTEGRGRGSGAAVHTPMGTVLDFRDGKISRIRAYAEHGEALRAAGLAE